MEKADELRAQARKQLKQAETLDGKNSFAVVLLAAEDRCQELLASIEAGTASAKDEKSWQEYCHAIQEMRDYLG